jgi:hypothetical protein
MATLQMVRKTRLSRCWSVPLGALLALSLALVATSAAAATDTQVAADLSHGVIESCVSHDALRIEADEPSALLSEADRDRIVADMRRQYPMLERDGFAPSQVILWLPRDGRSLYVALMQNPERPIETCFIALLDARKFAVTPLLRQANFLTLPAE